MRFRSFEEAKALADMGIIPAGAYTNKAYLSDKVAFTQAHRKRNDSFTTRKTSGRFIDCGFRKTMP